MSSRQLIVSQCRLYSSYDLAIIVTANALETKHRKKVSCANNDLSYLSSEITMIPWKTMT